MLGKLLLAAAWLGLHAELLRWLGRSFAHPDHRLNLGLFVAALLLLTSRLRLGPACVRPLPLLLALASAVLGVLVDRFVDLDLAAALLFGTGTLGLLGLYLAPEAFRASCPAVLLLVAALPFTDLADGYLGFAAREATAALAAPMLRGFGIAALRAETILVLENGAAHVDAPCSGLRSLWTGALLFLAATAVERRRLGLRWLLGGGAYAALLFFANLLRILALVGLGIALAAPRAAALVHAPLGVIGFLAASALALPLFRRAPAIALSERGPTTDGARSSVRLEPILAAVFLLLAGVHARRPIPAPNATLPIELQLPAELAVRPLPLEAAESDLVHRFGGLGATKLAFSTRSGAYAGQLLVVDSLSWRAHHPPELCFAGSGLRVRRVDSAPFPSFAARFVALEAPDRPLSAAYWFEAQHETTPSILARITADLTGRERRWVLVSVLFDRALSPAEAARPLEMIHHAVALALAAASPTEPSDETLL
jgi:exosortase O